MRIGVPVETAAAERRVALVPDSVARLVKAGHQVRVQRGAGAGAFHSDAEYQKAGATLVDGAAVFSDIDLVSKVRAPSAQDASARPALTRASGCTRTASGCTSTASGHLIT